MKRVDYARTYNKQWDHDNQTWMERRSKLEKAIILLLVLTGCGFIGLFSYHAVDHEESLDLCTNRNCLLTASQIATHVDPNVDPCDNFVEFSCGNFKKNVHASTRKSISDLVQRQLKEIIQEPINEEDHYMINKQKELYQKCMDLTAVTNESFPIFNGDLEELNGWPVVVGYHWVAKFFVWQDLIFGLKRKGYIFSMLLGIDVVPDPVVSNQFIVAIKPPTVSKVDAIYQNVYKNYMVQVAVALGAEPRLAGYEMEDVLEFINNLTKIADRNTVEGSNETEQRITVQQFQEHHNEIDWLEFFNEILYPSANITKDTFVIFPTTSYVKSFFYLLHKTPRRTQANYIIWKVLEDIMPFMSSNLSSFGSNYTCLTNRPSESRHELCKRVIYKNLYLQPSEVLYARKYLSDKKRIAVEEILTNIKSEFVKSLNESLRADDLVEKADSMVEIVGIQGDFYSDTIFDLYDSFNFTLGYNDSKGFFTLLLEFSRLHTDFVYSRCNTLQNETLKFTSQLKVKYSAVDKSIVVPAGILQEIYYDQNAPMFSNYGSLGSIIAYELVNEFVRVEMDKNNEWLIDTKASILGEMGCNLQDLEEFSIWSNTSNIDDNITTETISQYAALQLAFGAYQNWVQEHEEEIQLAGIDYSVNQMFWIFSVLPHCHKLNSKDPNDVILNSNFRNDFSCSSDREKNCTILP